MAEFFLALITGAVFTALYLSVSGKARWKQRARTAERQKKTNRKAYEIQNRVATDARFRKRVRDRFDDSRT